MAQRAFEVSCVVPVRPEEAIDFLTDLANHRGLHPFLVSAEVIAEGESVAGPFRQWQVLDRLRLGPVSYPLRYSALLTRASPTSFLSHVPAAPGCTIDAETTAVPGEDPGTAHVHERSLVRAPVGLLGYMVRNAELAHRRTMRLLPDVLGDSR